MAADGTIKIDVDADSKNAESTLSKLGSVAKTALTGITTAVAAAGAAFGALAVSALKAGGDLEQSLGGIETMFKDSSDKVVKNAKEAYKTAGISANEYMEQVTSFSARLLQGLGGDTEKAADIADMAMVDMADNANKFGADIASIQNAYQGFAKANYTMLDNLKLGYGGTASEMARLINDSGVMGETFKATAKNVNDVPFDKMIEAIHTIQVEMDVAGTTSKEAMETLTGSIGAAKAALDNFLSGAGGVDELVETFTVAGNNIVARLVELLPRLTEGLTQIIAGLLPLIGPMMETLLPAIVDGAMALVNGLVAVFPEVVQILIDALPQLIEGILTVLPELILAGVELLTALIEGMTDALPEIIPVAVDAINTLVQGLLENMPELLMAAMELIDELVTGLIDNPPELVDCALELIIGFTEGLIDALPELIERAPEIIAELIVALLSQLPKIWDAALKVIDMLVKGLFDNIGKINTAGIKILEDVARKLGLEGVAEFLKTGRQWIEGLWSGISDAGEWLWSKISSFFGGIVDKMKDFFGIHSPSKLMEDMIGEPLIMGIGVGWDKDAGKVKEGIMSDMEEIANFKMPRMSPWSVGGLTLAGAGGSSGSYGELIINNYNSIASDYDVSKIGRKMAQQYDNALRDKGQK